MVHDQSVKLKYLKSMTVTVQNPGEKTLIWHFSLGLITSRCSRKEPVLLPESSLGELPYEKVRDDRPHI